MEGYGMNALRHDELCSRRNKSLAILYKLKRFMLDRIDITGYHNSLHFSVVLYDKAGHGWHIATRHNVILEFIACGAMHDWLQGIQRRQSTVDLGMRFKATLALDDYAVIYEFVKSFAAAHNGLKLTSISTRADFNFFEAHETAESIIVEWDLKGGKSHAD